MILTAAVLKELCHEKLSPLNKYDTVKLQIVKRSIYNRLMYVLCKVHDHRHAFVLKTRESFRMHTNSFTAELPTIPTRPAEELGETNYKKYA